MNERIREIYEEAHELKPIIMMDPVTCQAVHKLGHNDVPMYHQVFNPEKFAKLIARECMKVASPNYMSTPEDSVYYVEEAIDRIAEHFGVE